MPESSPSAPDLTACDREPIHMPGAIQPHGLLIVADASSLIVVAGAGAIEERLAGDWLGRSLGDLVGEEIAAAAAGGTARHVRTPAMGTTERFHATIHRGEGHVLIELEPIVRAPMATTEALDWLGSTTADFDRAPSVAALCARAAMAFRALTGFDRVMIYRFGDDGAGRVVAEDRDPGQRTFLHHHFPATDIPQQARALYIRNLSRSIPAIDYAPAPLRPAGFEGLDLSDVAIRSVSPIHLRYLRNMGVGASASISIVYDGMLWGLVACHHGSSRALPPDVAAIGVALAGDLARQLRAKEEVDFYRGQLRLRATEATITARLAAPGPLRTLVEATADDLRAMLDADGFAFVQGEAIDLTGICPAVSAVAQIAGWARGRKVVEPYATQRLSASMPDAEAFCARASGLMALPLEGDDAVLLWFRSEQIEEIEWAGNPHKDDAAGDDAILTPRASFESWRETVRGISRRWTHEQTEAAHRLRRAFQNMQPSGGYDAAHGDLARIVADRDAQLAQKDVLLKEVNHRVQNSLQLISTFLALQTKSAGAGEVAVQLGEAQQRVLAVALVHRRLFRDEEVGAIDLSRYFDELIGEIGTIMGAAWGQHLTMDLAPVLVPTDRAAKLGLILTQLVMSARQHAYGGDSGPLAIVLQQHGDRLRLIVTHDGGGRDGPARFGTRMMNVMVEALGGTITSEDEDRGLRCIVTVPVEDGGR